MHPLSAIAPTFINADAILDDLHNSGIAAQDILLQSPNPNLAQLSATTRIGHPSRQPQKTNTLTDAGAELPWLLSHGATYAGKASNGQVPWFFMLLKKGNVLVTVNSSSAKRQQVLAIYGAHGALVHDAPDAAVP